MASCRVVARLHAGISFEATKPKNLAKKAYLPHKRMKYIYRKKKKNIDTGRYRPKERTREIESNISNAF